MFPSYQFRLNVRCPDGKTLCAAFDLPLHEVPQLEPYDLCDRPLEAMMTGGITRISTQRIDMDRKRFIQTISEALTANIFDAIKARDTHNGYPQNASDQATASE